MKIHCEECGTLMGDIRDASLRKGIVYVCKACYYPKPKTPSHGKAVNDLMSMFKMRR